MPNYQILGVEAAGEWVRSLCGGKIHLGLTGSLQSPNLDVADHTHNGPRVIQVAECLADRILAGPVTFSERRAHDSDPCMIAAVAVFDITAAVKGNPHRPEILRGNPAMAHTLSPVGSHLPARDCDPRDETGCYHRQPAGERRAFHPRHGPHLREHAIVELDALQRLVVLRARQGDMERENVLGP